MHDSNSPPPSHPISTPGQLLGGIRRVRRWGWTGHPLGRTQDARPEVPRPCQGHRGKGHWGLGLTSIASMARLGTESEKGEWQRVTPVTELSLDSRQLSCGAAHISRKDIITNITRNLPLRVASHMDGRKQGPDGKPTALGRPFSHTYPRDQDWLL